MSFTPKVWEDSPNTTTPLDAAAMDDLETRLSGYTDTALSGLVKVTSITANGTTLSGAVTLTSDGTIDLSVSGQTVTLSANGVAQPILIPLAAAPTSSDGQNGDYAGVLSGDTMAWYGPKASGAWPSSGGTIGGPLTITAQTGAYTFALTDAGTEVDYNSTSAGTFTIPPNSSVAFPVGTVISCRQIGTGQLTIAAGSGVTLHTANAATTRVQWSLISITQISANTWVVDGDS